VTGGCGRAADRAANGALTLSRSLQRLAPDSFVRVEERIMEPVENLLKTTLGEIERVLSSKSVVGDPIKIEGATVIPLVSIGFGFGAGGGSGKDPKNPQSEGSGEGSGGGGGVKPVAVILVTKDGVRVEPVRNGAASVVEKLGEAVSKVVEKRAEVKA
jgi:uncharacterized spore protein YtfJ